MISPAKDQHEGQQLSLLGQRNNQLRINQMRFLLVPQIAFALGFLSGGCLLAGMLKDHLTMGLIGMVIGGSLNVYYWVHSEKQNQKTVERDLEAAEERDAPPD